MKKEKIFGTLLVAVCMCTSLLACGGNKGNGVDKTYTVSYDNTMEAEVLETIPSYQFVADNLSYLVAYGTNLDVTLDLDKDGRYTLTAKYYNQDNTVTEADPAYCDVHVEAKGTYTMEEDKVTISKATDATAVYQGGAYITEQGMFTAFSYNEDGSTGEWSSTDVPEILDCVPGTVFTVTEDGAIVTWEAAGDENGNPHAQVASQDDGQEEAESTEAASTEVESIEAGTEGSDEAAGFNFDCDWVATMTLNGDGTYKFELADYQIVEEGTWTYADGVLTVTKPSGETCESNMDGEVMKLDYVSDASEQLVGEFYSANWADFFQ